jgi:hypothetical protein
VQPSRVAGLHAQHLAAAGALVYKHMHTHMCKERRHTLDDNSSYIYIQMYDPQHALTWYTLEA